MKTAKRSALLVAIALILVGALFVGYDSHITSENRIYQDACRPEAKANYDSTHPDQIEECERETEQNRRTGVGMYSDLTETCLNNAKGEMDQTQCRDLLKCGDCLEAQAAKASLDAFESGPGWYGPLAVVSGFVIFALGLFEKVLRISLKSAVATLSFISASAAAICIVAFILVPKKTAFLAVPATFLFVAAYFFIGAVNRFIYERFGNPERQSQPPTESPR